MSEPSSTLEEGLAVARSALEGGRPAEAAVGLKALTRQFPGEAEPYRLLSIAFHQAGDRAAALDAARSAVVARPESAGCQYQLGVTAYDRGDRETARAAYEKALSLRPGLAPAWVNLGRLHDDSFRFDDALICYERALMLTPDQPIAHTNRGNTLLALERYAEAATAFSRALQAAPSHAAALLGQATALAEMGLLEQVAELPGPYCFVSEAVLIYLDEPQVEQVVRQIGARFPGAWLVLDTTDSHMVDTQHKHDAMKTLSKDAWFRWRCDDPMALEAWGLRLERSRSFLEMPDALKAHLPWLYRMVFGPLSFLIRRKVDGYRINRFVFAEGAPAP